MQTSEYVWGGCIQLRVSIEIALISFKPCIYNDQKNEAQTHSIKKSTEVLTMTLFGGLDTHTPV